MMMKKKKNQICSSTSLLRDDHDHDHDHHKKKKKLLIGSTTTTSNRSEEILPEDLILEIFTHLPSISLLRFKSVSKSLHSLISNPDFLRRNTVHQFRRQDPSPLPPPGILLKLGQELSGDSRIHMISPSHLHGDNISDRGYCYYSQLLQNLIHYRPEYDQPDGDENDQKVKFFTIIDSCNGLLLYLNCVGHPHNPPGGKCIWYPPGGKRIWYVCNPITKDYIELPPLEEEQGLEIVQYSLANLVFDPSLSLTYKVVIWLLCREDYRLYVYSSETRSWRLSVKTNINDFLFRVIQEQHNDIDFRAVLLNGVLYWSTLIARIMDISLCYDVEKDSVWTLKFPKMPVGYVRRQLFYFGVCGGGLRLIEKYYKQLWYWEKTFPSSFDVMEMNQLQLQQQHQDYQDGNIEDRDLWTVKYRVNIGDQEGYYANLIREKTMYGVFILDLYKTTTKAAGGEGEEVLMCTRNHHNDCLVISFNLSDNTFGKELQHRDHFLGFTSVLRYANITLFPLIH